MKLSHFYNLAVKFGAACDVRSNRKNIKSFADTAILYGSPDEQIRKILVGIDIEVAELLLADKIRKENGLDLVLSHHPEGRAYAALYEVMRLQVEMLVKAGLEYSVANALLEERMNEVARKIMSANHLRPVDAARLLDLPFICVHTPADNHVSSYLKSLFAKERPKTVQDILDLLMEIPEYKKAKKESGNAPSIILGNPKRPVGKIFLEMTGGTEGNKDVYDKLYKTGVRSIVSMHLSEEHFRKVKDANLNVVITGHISSDTLGLNLLLDKIEASSGDDFEVISCSGFRRIKR